MSKDGYQELSAPPSYDESMNQPPAQNPMYPYQQQQGAPAAAAVPGNAGFYPPQSSVTATTYPAAQATTQQNGTFSGYYPAQTAYPQGPANYPQQKVPNPPQPAQPSVASPNQVIIQSNSGNRQVTVVSNTSSGSTGAVVIEAPRSTGPVYTEARTTPFPVTMNCPYCTTRISSRLNYVQGHQNWVAAGVLCFLGLWICAPFPLCMNSCSDVEHYCPSCNRFLGKFNRLGC